LVIIKILIRKEPFYGDCKGTIKTDHYINSVGDVYILFKNSFKDMLRVLLEAEMDISFDYEKI